MAGTRTAECLRDCELTDIVSRMSKVWVEIMGSVGQHISLVIKELYAKVEVHVNLVNR